MLELATQLIEEFVAEVSPRVFEHGQGYERSRPELVILEFTWYRKNEHTWLLGLTAETERLRVRTPPDTTFDCNPAFERTQQINALSRELSVSYFEMLHTPATNWWLGEFHLSPEEPV